MIVDTVLFAALSDEYAAMERMLDSLEPASVMKHQGEFDLYEISTLRNGVSVVLVPPTLMGHTNAATAAACLLHDLKPRVSLLSGIAGCLASKQSGKYALGDIAVSDQIVDYELEKIVGLKSERRSSSYNTNLALGRAIRRRLSEWPRQDEDLPPRPGGHGGSPQVHVVNYLSGNQVVASEERKLDLLKDWPNSAAVEMESAGIAAMLRGMRLADRFLMVKSFTDWADGTKNDEWRAYACAGSAAYVGFLLTEIIPTWLDSIRRPREDEEYFARRVGYAARCFFGARANDVPFVRGMAQAVVDQAIGEACTLSTLAESKSDFYETQVGTGHQFLVRAEPLFRGAKQIIATSLDSVSTFWMDKRNSTTAKAYIDSHPSDHDGGRVMRLFVFSTPENAHAHSKLLDYHAKKFENTLVTSREFYRKLLETHVAPNATEKYMNKDFAVLECPVASNLRWYFADLDYDKFTLREAKPGGQLEVDRDATIALFGKLEKIKLGSLDPAHGVLKWDRNHWAKQKEWAAHLTAMFGEPTADAFHLVSFKLSENEYSDLRTVLADIKHEIFDDKSRSPQTLAERYGIRDVWLAKQLPRTDGLQVDLPGGRIHYPVDPSMGYILLMRFRDSESLTAFLRDPRHFEMRLRVFGKFNGVVQELMRSFNISKSQDFTHLTDRAGVLHNAIEKLAAEHMRRYDYREDELIDEIVRVDPPHF